MNRSEYLAGKVSHQDFYMAVAQAIGIGEAVSRHMAESETVGV